MEKQHNRTICGTGFCVTDLQRAGFDLLHGGEGYYRFGSAGLGPCGTDQTELGGGDGHGGGADKAAAVVTDLCVHGMSPWFGVGLSFTREHVAASDLIACIIRR